MVSCMKPVVFLLCNNLFIYQVLCTLIYRRRSIYSFLLDEELSVWYQSWYIGNDRKDNMATTCLDQLFRMDIIGAVYVGSFYHIYLLSFEKNG